MSTEELDLIDPETIDKIVEIAKSMPPPEGLLEIEDGYVVAFCPKCHAVYQLGRGEKLVAYMNFECADCREVESDG